MISSQKEILITEHTLLSEIQSAFNNNYPFLKIEFLKLDSEKNTSQKLKKIEPETTVKVISSSEMAATLNIEGNRTIAEIETDVKNVLGLAVQFSRKSGNVWNVITLTDNWTLEDQNNAGKFISTEMSLTNTKH